MHTVPLKVIIMVTFKCLYLRLGHGPGSPVHRDIDSLTSHLVHTTHILVKYTKLSSNVIATLSGFLVRTQALPGFSGQVLEQLTSTETEVASSHSSALLCPEAL